jgi:hypothetical protein
MEVEKLMKLEALKKFTDPEKEKIIKAATTFPICGGNLETSVQLGIRVLNSSYCPNCNITRWAWLSIPVLCIECHSRYFIGLIGEPSSREDRRCWFCGGKMEDFSFQEFDELKKKGVLQKGFYYSDALEAVIAEIDKEDAKCKHIKSTSEPIHWKDRTFYFQCKLCGRKQFFYIYPQTPRFPKKV